MLFPQRTSEQADYFGVTIDETKQGGNKATQAVRAFLSQPFVVWTRWASAQGRAKSPRYYGLVVVGGTNLVEYLVSQGMAQIKGVTPNLPTGEKSNSYKQKLLSLETEAREKKAGLWANSKKETSSASDGK